MSHPPTMWLNAKSESKCLLLLFTREDSNFVLRCVSTSWRSIKPDEYTLHLRILTQPNPTERSTRTYSDRAEQRTSL